MDFLLRGPLNGSMLLPPTKRLCETSYSNTWARENIWWAIHSALNCGHSIGRGVENFLSTHCTYPYNWVITYTMTKLVQPKPQTEHNREQEKDTWMQMIEENTDSAWKKKWTTSRRHQRARATTAVGKQEIERKGWTGDNLFHKHKPGNNNRVDVAAVYIFCIFCSCLCTFALISITSIITMKWIGPRKNNSFSLSLTGITASMVTTFVVAQTHTHTHTNMNTHTLTPTWTHTHTTSKSRSRSEDTHFLPLFFFVISLFSVNDTFPDLQFNQSAPFAPCNRRNSPDGLNNNCLKIGLIFRKKRCKGK